MSSFDSKREVTGIACFFAAIALTLMYYLPSITGKAGVIVRSIGFGLIGNAAFLIPLFLFYASIDYFFEKRKGVSHDRLAAVIVLIVIVSSLFAVTTMDFTYFKNQCVDSHMHFKANKAISLLWKSGIDNSLISDPSSSGIRLSGGIIGGGVATALYTIAGKVLAILSLVVYLLCQIVLIFHVSLKQTAKKAVKKLSNKPVARKDNIVRQQPRPAQGTRPNNVVATTPSKSHKEEYVTSIVNPNGVERVNDPFSPKRMPVDRNTGFIDLSDSSFGVNNNNEANVINFENRKFDVDSESPSADFDYTAMPLNAPYREPKKNSPTLSFLATDNKDDFYDLGDGSEHLAFVQESALQNANNYLDGATINEYQETHQYDDPNDLPIEIIDDYEENSDDNPYDYMPKEVSINHQVRTPNIVVLKDDSSNDEEFIDDLLPIDNRSDISINAEDDNKEGFSRTEGRIIETSQAPEPVPQMPSEEVKKQPRVFAKKVNYKPAPLNLLAEDKATKTNVDSSSELKAKAIKLEETLDSFGIKAKVNNITHGPAITRFELSIATGTKVSRVLNLQDDIQLAMATMSIRIEAPIPGKSAIGIEIPNDKTSAVQLRGLLNTKEFKESTPLTVALGKDIPGKPIYCDLAKMPHLMIAGSTGSGKSVCINTILTSILCKATPDQVRLILIDPKVVELSIYNGIPHLIMPVVTNPKEAAGTLKWAVIEMNRRYQLFADHSVRDAKGYNEMANEYNRNVDYENSIRKNDGREPLEKKEILPLILIVVDELADLMTVAAKEVEEHIARLAAMARAAGLHMIIATQRPSVDVITGTIKSNIPSRIAFAVSSGIDSRTILDSNGAEKLLGKGDMLYAPLSAPKPVRGQGAFVSDKEVEGIVKHFKNNYEPNYDEAIIQSVKTGMNGGGSSNSGSSDASSGSESGDDSLFESAVDVVIEQGRASVSILQRRLGIGYPRAGKLIDELEARGIIGGFEGSKPRKVLITKTDWLEMKAKGK